MTKPLAHGLSIALALAALACFAACGGGEEKPAANAPAPAAEPAPVPSAEAPAPAAEPPAQAAAAATAGTPFPCIAGDAERGKAKYAQFCWTCHGTAGGGDGPASADLTPKPAHHNDGAYMNALSNEHLLKVIREGGAAVGKSPMMAPWGATLGDQGVLDVAAFVRTLATPPYACP